MTPKRNAQEYKRLQSPELEKIKTVYGDTAYIPKDRRPGHMIPLYQRNGLRIVEQGESGKRNSGWMGVYLHPDNILTPFSPPMCGDYIQLLDGNGKPCENHSEVFIRVADFGMHLYLVEDMSGESFAVTRLEEFDTDRRRAWQQVITGVAP